MKTYRDVIKYSTSSIQVAQQCLRKYDFKYMRGLEPVKDDTVKSPTGFGKIAHHAAEVFCKKEKIDEEVIGERNDENEADIVKAMVLGGIAVKELDSLADEIIASEEGFEIQISNNNYKLIGYYDNVIRINGRLWVTDYKFVASLNTMEHYQNSLQGNNYIQAVEDKYDETVAGVIFIEIKKPTTKPLLVNLLDENGKEYKIPKLDEDGNEVLTKTGKVSMTTAKRREDMLEYSTRLKKLIQDNPLEYINPISIKRDQYSMDLTEVEIASVHNMIDVYGRNNTQLPRSTGNCIKYHKMCEYASICNLENEDEMMAKGFAKTGRLHFSPEEEDDQF